MPTASDGFVSLHGGLTVPVAPLILLLDLEARGLRVWVEAGDVLIEPPGRLNESELAQLRRWKSHLLALLTYVPPVH